MTVPHASQPPPPPPPPREPLWHLGHPHEHLPFYELPDDASPPVRRRTLASACAAALVLAACSAWLKHRGDGAAAPIVPWRWGLPFAALLASIALMPFAAKHFWERFYWAVSLGLGLLVAGYYVIFLGPAAAWTMARSFSEYVSFMFLLGSLFIVSGGILIRVRRTATPAVNTALLLTGAVLANAFGTTGAAMLLIRPYLRINREHIRPYHIVFFIFLVANMGGALTPVGDPPLFLGYLKGVPFWWVLEHGWPIWTVATGALLLAFFARDAWEHRKASRPPHEERGLGPAVSIFGASNVLFIALILAAVFLPAGWREGLMALAACGSLAMTPRRIHGENRFNFAPIREVALLFAGIFATMVPALDHLHHGARESPELYALVSTPGRSFYATGALSSVLDNAPTYLTFLETEVGKLEPEVVRRAKAIVHDPLKIAPTADDLAGLPREDQRHLADALSTLRAYHGDDALRGGLRDEQIEIGLLLSDRDRRRFLLAISMGAVFFGACTYIGNGPNFMVKSIAEQNGIRCPSFLGYVLMYTVPLLLPTFALVWALFLR